MSSTLAWERGGEVCVCASTWKVLVGGDEAPEE